jgi:hypothetical protein
LKLSRDKALARPFSVPQQWPFLVVLSVFKVDTKLLLNSSLPRIACFLLAAAQALFVQLVKISGSIAAGEIAMIV